MEIHLDVEVTWHPFQLHPDMPLEGHDRKEFTANKFGSPERAREIYDNCRNAGNAVGNFFLAAAGTPTWKMTFKIN